MRLPPEHSRPPSEENALETIAWPRFRVSIRLTLRGSPKRASSLPEVYHLIQLPPDLPPTANSKLMTVVSNIPCKQVTFIGFGCHKL
jgi:hypothetical protein